MIRERLPQDGTTFKGHKNLQQDSAIEWDYQRKQQNHTSNHRNFYLKLHVIDPIYFDSDHSVLHWSIWKFSPLHCLPVSMVVMMKMVEVPQCSRCICLLLVGRGGGGGVFPGEAAVEHWR